MPARMPHATTLAILTWSFAALGAPDASAQALCPHDDAPFGAERLVPPPYAVSIDAEFVAPGGMAPEGSWRLKGAGGAAEDGLALEGVSFKRTIDPGFGSIAHAYVVTVDLRAWGNKVTDLELVLAQGARRLRLGAIEKIAIRCQVKSVSRTFTIDDRDFAWLFGAGETPTLVVTRTTRAADGC